MTAYQKIHKLASNWLKLSQVLDLGTSEVTRDEKIQQAKKYKQQIETYLPILEPVPGWSKPGVKVLYALEKFIAGNPLTEDDKDWALLDVRGNIQQMDYQEFEQFIKTL